MSKQLEAWLAAELTTPLRRHYGTDANAIAGRLSPVLIRIAAGQLGAAALHECLAALGKGLEPIRALAGRSFGIDDLKIGVRQRDGQLMLTFEDLVSRNASAIVLRKVLTPQPDPLAPLHYLGRNWQPLLGGGAVGALSVALLLSQFGTAANDRPIFNGSEPIPTINTAFQTPLNGMSRLAATGRVDPVTRPTTPSTPLSSQLPTSTALTIVGSFPTATTATTALIGISDSSLNLQGWSVVYGGAPYVKTLGPELGDPDVSGWLMLIALKVKNDTGLAQPFPTGLLSLATSGGPLLPVSTLSQRYVFYDQSGALPGGYPGDSPLRRRAGLDSIPVDAQQYLVFLAFDVPPGTRSIVLYDPRTSGRGWRISEQIEVEGSP